MPGPHAVVVVHEPDNRADTGPTQIQALPLNFPATRQAVSLGAPLGRHASRRSPGIKSCHLTWSTHGTPTLPAKFSEEDVAPHLHEAECWRTRRGGSRGLGKHEESADATTSSWVSPSVARPPSLIRDYFSYRSSPSESTLLSS